MLKIICVVRDRVTDMFMHPFCVPTEAAAIRDFADQVNRADQNNPLYMHPGDYELFAVGTFEDRECVFQTGSPRSIALGDSLVKKE